MNWHEYAIKHGKLPEWPYEISYGKENVVESDVLVVGGGVAGCRAAIAALQQGASVAVAERGFTKRSGLGGAGVDHWHGAVTNPCSKITPEMYSDTAMKISDGYTNGLARYIIGKEGWDTLLELEEMGVQIRDEDDEFKDTMFRDEETKLLFAYDLDNKHCLRVYGNNIKPCLDAEMRRLGAGVYDRTCITALLTEGGRQGARVIGAMGVNDRTGEFFVFKAKAVVVATGGGKRLGSFAPELTESQSMFHINLTNMGHTIAWNAGAELVMMDQLYVGGLDMGYAPYSMGNADNTYQGAPTVDANGVRVQHASATGTLLTDERQIFQSANPDTFVIGHGIGLGPTNTQEYSVSTLDHALNDKISSGELRLPLYNDFTLLDEKHRRLIWGLMLSHEGKTRVPIYETLSKWGFDPDKDMLQYAVTNAELLSHRSSWTGLEHSPKNWVVTAGGGGIITDWRLQGSLPGMFAAGGFPLFGSGCHGEAQTTGRYAGRQAARFASEHDSAEPDRAQIEREKRELFAPVENEGGDIGWKELNYAIARVVQDYCGRYKTEEILDLGIKRLKDLRDTEGRRTYANNPHELGRLVECFRLIDLGICYMEAAKARKASSKILGFSRVDYPEMDPPEWNCLLPISQSDGQVHVRKLPCDYYRQAPYSDCLAENYEKYTVPAKKEAT
ncbi:MAG: FAD-binding protein [Oscillospiraceae bacterium]|jgi:succinate dehydrogenase/fumarate reductase flavoprotein subunit|nr:FAD-binding protein [Oscillospiraceae bacterium]